MACVSTSKLGFRVLRSPAGLWGPHRDPEPGPRRQEAELIRSLQNGPGLFPSLL